MPDLRCQIPTAVALALLTRAALGCDQVAQVSTKTPWKFPAANGGFHVVAKVDDGSTEILDAIRAGHVAYVINTMDVRCEDSSSGSSQIRRCAVENGVTMLTALDTVRVLLDVLEEITLGISTIDA